MTTPEPVTRLNLERLALGDLPAAEAAALQQQIDGDADLAARAVKIQSEIARSREALPALDLDRAANVARTAGLAEERPGLLDRLRFLLRPMPLALAGATAALALFLLWPGASDDVPTEQFRGSFDLELTLVRDGAATPQGALVTAQAGDRLQWRVTPGAAGWFSVFDVQDDGVVSAWARPTEVPAMIPIDGAVLLDDFAGSERVFFVLSDAPVGLQTVRGALERKFQTPIVELDTLPGAPEAASQRSVLVSKAAK
jgi:hypothetical protein